MTVVLDAGALIGIERGDRDVAALLEVARRTGRPVVDPSGVVAQVWRGGSRLTRVAWLLGASGVSVEPLTDPLARAAGVLCGCAGTSDVVDASVVVSARLHRATVLSADRADLEALDPTVAVVDC